jgi:hypothetical protein
MVVGAIRGRHSWDSSMGRRKMQSSSSRRSSSRRWGRRGHQAVRQGPQQDLNLSWQLPKLKLRHQQQKRCKQWLLYSCRHFRALSSVCASS